MAAHWTTRLRRSFSGTGLILGTLFFAASLTPSLIPRTYVTQGVLSGCSFAAGYLLGVLFRWLWEYLELPLPKEKTERVTKLIAAAVCAAIGVFFLWQTAEWQNSIRALMQLERVDSAHPTRVGLIALVVFALLVALARLFQLALRLISCALARYIPRRVSNVIGTVLAVSLAWSLVNGVLLKSALRLADSSFRQFDALMEVGIDKPSDPMKTGSTASLIGWRELGRTGRGFVAATPTKEQVSDFLGREAMEPTRVYVGLNSAETPRERARLALDEMKRVGAFERSVLVIVVPTGTGWVDPEAISPLEYLHGGDIASVAVQYSYLTSWLSLLVEPSYGAETAHALFNEVYGHWRTMPKDNRPKLYLYGLSLGALNSEASSDMFDIIGDPYHGALWAGPPFASSTWASVTASRQPDSPAWLPRFRDSSVVRFTNQQNKLDIPGASWGPIRIVYLQYASDPVTFFDPYAVYRQPEWMSGERGPDVSASFRWFPVVTLLQLTLDMAMATTTPLGYGHLYAASHYIDAWVAVTDPQGWSEADIDRLKAYFAAQAEQAEEP